MLTRDERLELENELWRRIRNAREQRFRERLVERFPAEHISPEALTKKDELFKFLEIRTDQELMLLRRELRVAFDPLEKRRRIRPDSWKNVDETTLFVSYKSEMEEYADRLANALRPHGFVSFVARYQISPTADWQEEIERALFTMDSFVTIHSKGTREAPWPMQEVGVAYALKVPAVVVAIDESPEGLIRKVQAIRTTRNEEINMVALRVAQALRSEINNKRRAFNCWLHGPESNSCLY